MKITSTGRVAVWFSLVTGFLFTASLYAQEAEFAHLATVIDEEMANKDLPLLSIVLVDKDGVVWSHGAGVDDAGSALPADNRTTYRIGSVSKLFTDIAVMQMVERGVVDLDEPVTTYLPEFRPDNPYGKPITLRLLMSHGSGLVREPPVGNYFDPDFPSLEATVASLNRTRLVYEPGTKTQYSNAGIAVVGRVVEKLSGRPFATALSDNILAPLGMRHSAFTPEEDVISRLPTAYMWSYQGDRTPAPTFELGMAPAGSMYSNMNDLALFMRALIGKGRGPGDRILQEETLQTMWTPQSDVASGRNRSFGIGFGLGELDGEKSVSHGGAIYGFATQLKVLPERGIGVAVATNLDMANGAINRIGDYALRVLIAVNDGKAPPPYMVSTPIAGPLAEKLLGRYAQGDETIEVVRRFDDLYIERIRGLSLRLRSIDGKVVIDDQMTFSEAIEFDEGGVTVFGEQYMSVAETKPKPVDPAFVDLLGEYGYDHNILYVSEKFGKLHALIEWGTEYPLVKIGANRYQLPAYGLYPNEYLEFQRDEYGAVVSVSLSGVEFVRRAVGNIDGDVFRIVPVAPVAELEKQALQASPPKEAGPFLPSKLVDITKYSDTLKLDIRYAGNDNFLGVPVYRTAEAFMQSPAADALSRASRQLEKLGFGLLVHDAYRPWYVTKIFWDATPLEGKRFVADPSQGSRHNRGCAIDLTLYDLKTGEPIEMVGVYDEMSPRSYPHYPGGTSLQRWHREVLRAAMEAEGFDVYEYEWWHFDFQGWENYPIETRTFESLH